MENPLCLVLVGDPTPSGPRASLDVAGENTVAQFVSAPRDALVRKVLPVAQIANVCSCCKKEREEEHKMPRSLTRLPSEVTQDKLFKRKGLPVRVCAFCDGDVLGSALAQHDARTT